MSNAFATYIEKYFLNPASATDIEDPGNEETSANVTQKIIGEEGFSGASIPISQLRIQNSKFLSEGDSKYRGKKISRRDIDDVSSIKHDPELAKYFTLDDKLGEDEFSSSDEEKNNISSRRNKSFKKDLKLTRKKEQKVSSQDEDLFLQMGEEIESDSGQEESENDDHGENEDMEDEDEDGSEEYEEESDDTEELDDVEENLDSVDQYESDHVDQDPSNKAFKTFSDNDSEQIQKGVAVKNQCGVFDTLFEIRIGMQKILSIANQLPQHDSYELFLSNKDYPQYRTNLVTARKSLKKLLDRLIIIQEILLTKNSETKHITESSSGTNSSANIDTTGIELEEGLSKGKRKMKEYEEILTKRHRALSPYSSTTLKTWHERSKLLGKQSKNKFASFDILPTQQIQNILSNKDQLIKRTQMIGVSRGNVCEVLGKRSSQQDDLSTEEYDEEIFDDTDFYSRMLEDLLKSKVSVSEDMSEVSRKWIDIQKLRKKAKKKVDTKASKGRKIRFEVMSKLQQYLVPCKLSLMEDSATNRLFSSLFGQSLNLDNLSNEK